jgi:hypothetical protein
VFCYELCYLSVSCWNSGFYNLADCFSLAAYYYTHGKELTEVIWKETMEELKGTGAVEILESL